MTERWKKKFTVNTRRSKLGALKIVLRHIAKLGGPDLSGCVPRSPNYQPRGVVATPEEIAAMLGKSAPWMRCFLLLCGQLGLRFSEAAHACPANWSEQLHTLSIVCKGPKTRILPTTPELEELFKMSMRFNAPLSTPFIWLLLGKPVQVGPNIGQLDRVPSNFVHKEWHRMKKRLGINPELKIHDLRRTRITEVYRQTLDVKLAQQFAGHDSIASTALYLAPWDDARMLDVIRRTAPPGGWKTGKEGN